MKERKSFDNIVIEIRDILEKNEEMSIRQISKKTGSQWRTAEKALVLLRELNIVKERKNEEVERVERLFGIIKKGMKR